MQLVSKALSYPQSLPGPSTLERRLGQISTKNSPSRPLSLPLYLLGLGHHTNTRTEPRHATGSRRKRTTTHNHHTHHLEARAPFRFLPLSKKRGLWSSTTRKKHSTSAHSAHRPTCACSCDKAANHFTQIKFVARSPRRPKPKIVYQETRNAPGTTSRLAGRIEPSAVDKVENSCS